MPNTPARQYVSKNLTPEELERRACEHDQRQRAMGIPREDWRVSLPRYKGGAGGGRHANGTAPTIKGRK